MIKTPKRVDARIVAPTSKKRGLKRLLKKAGLSNRRKAQAVIANEGDEASLTFKRAWLPDSEIEPWLFRLGQVARGSSFALTNIPARTH